MRPGQRRHRRGEVLVEGGLLGAVLDQLLVQLEHHRAGVPVGEVGDVGGVAQPAQRGQVGVGPDLFAERLGHRAVHGLDRPLPGDVDLLQRAVVAGTHEHVLAVGGLRRVLDQLAAAVDPHVVVGVRLVGLQQRELGVVAEVDALVAERAAQLEDPLDAADAQPLQVQLGGDAQIEVEVVGVDVGEERPGVRAAVDLLQDRGLDLQETPCRPGFRGSRAERRCGPGSARAPRC